MSLIRRAGGKGSTLGHLSSHQGQAECVSCHGRTDSLRTAGKETDTNDEVQILRRMD